MKFGKKQMGELLQSIFGIIVVAIAGWVAWMSNVLISEKKERQKHGITDYYDMPIRKDDK